MNLSHEQTSNSLKKVHARDHFYHYSDTTERGSGIVGEDVVHHAGGAPRRRVVVVGVALEGERGGGVPGEGLKVPDDIAVLNNSDKQLYLRANTSPARIALTR